MFLFFGEKACAHAAAANPSHLQRICYLYLNEQFGVFEDSLKLMGDLLVTSTAAGSGSCLHQVCHPSSHEQADKRGIEISQSLIYLEIVYIALGYGKYCADQDNHPSDIDLTPVCSNLFFQITLPAATYHYLKVILQ